MAIVSGANGSRNYYAGVTVSVSDNTANSKTAKITVTPYLKHTTAVTRYQHHWTVRYYQDYNVVDTWSGNLPNDTSQAGVVDAGHLKMVANQWYQWGPSKTFTVDKINAKTVKYTITLECTGTVPRNVLCGNGYYPPYQSVALVSYYIDPTDPKDVTASFNEDTRVLSYSWSPAACYYVQLYRNWYDEDGTPLKQGYINVAGRTNNKLYNGDLPIKETLSDEVAKVTYEVINVSISGHSKNSGGKKITIDSYSKVWIKVNGAWKKAIPWVKVNGVWKKVTKTWVKVNGVWKRTTS